MKRRGRIHNGRRFSNVSGTIFSNKSVFGSIERIHVHEKVQGCINRKGPFVRSIDILVTTANTARPEGNVLSFCPRRTA